VTDAQAHILSCSMIEEDRITGSSTTPSSSSPPQIDKNSHDKDDEADPSSSSSAELRIRTEGKRRGNPPRFATELYAEEAVWPLNSSTNCYTGARLLRSDGTFGDDPRSNVLMKWATERHHCRLVPITPKDDADDHDHDGSFPVFQLQSRAHSPVEGTDDEDCTIGAGAVPGGGGNSDEWVCVGYSASTNWDVFALLRSHANTASAVLVPESSRRQQQFQQQQQQQQHSSIDDGETSVMLASSSAPSSTEHQHLRSHHRRSSSHVSAGAGSESSFGLTHSAGDSPSSNLNATHNNSADLESTANLASDGEASTGAPARPRRCVSAQLIFRHQRPDQRHHCCYSTTVDFRPLAVRAFESAITTDTTNTTTAPISGLWCGSADSSKLYCYVPSPDIIFRGTNNGSLLSVDLSDYDRVFAFSTPVMAIEFLSPKGDDDDECCLAAASQDGTVRIIQFRMDNTSLEEEENEATALGFQSVRHSQVIIDGPITCLHMRPVTTGGKNMIHLTMGSLCGYAAGIVLDRTENDLGVPFMIAEGFWNVRLNAEDSVLSVYSTADTVLIGTHSGRLFLYCQKQTDTANDNRGSSSYQLQWECRLPYSVFAVSCLPDGRLLATTRRTVHIFRKCDNRPSYIVDAASRANAYISDLLEQVLHEKTRTTESNIEPGINPMDSQQTEMHDENKPDESS
jgi:hypothetical protein